jgi:hypothetical protein
MGAAVAWGESSFDQETDMDHFSKQRSTRRDRAGRGWYSDRIGASTGESSGAATIDACNGAATYPRGDGLHRAGRPAQGGRL